MKVRVVGGFLGAGKTTAIQWLARHHAGRGEQVAVITNDQGSALVDTAIARAGGTSMVREIAGGCFCCRYSELEAALEDLATGGASVAIAEAVGSCTDLVATVLAPLADRRGDRIQLEPLTVVVDPWRLSEVQNGGFSPDVEYLFRKQVEEAGVVLVSRADTRPPDVTPWLRMVRADAAVVSFSGLTGEGLDDWLAARPVSPAPPLVLDYDRYAAAEASLGWLNARAEVLGEIPFAPGDVMRRFLDELANLPVAHAKVAMVEPAHGVAARVRRGERVRVETPPAATDPTHWMRLLINARVATSPAMLEATVRRALARAARPARIVWDTLACFAPARPTPEHRYAFRCGSGDDPSCCAAFYQRPDVRYLLGDSLHPGGVRLTLALASELGLASGVRLLDVACGRGESLHAIVGRWPVSATGVDAGSWAAAGGTPFAFVRGDAHALPFEDGTFDAVLCECGLSTFADPARALAEIHRVLAPKGRLAMSDMVVEGPIPETLRPLSHAGACLAGAKSDAGYRALLGDARLRVERAWDESTALAETLSRIKRKLVGFALAKASGAVPTDVTIDLGRARELVREAERTLRTGAVRYGAYIARKETPN
jgi:SAM-dependent methyltransferase/Ni2+-binding GTPase involved in maturation of urease and hydrogenase